jgi:Uma2 family endonuclease
MSLVIDLNKKYSVVDYLSWNDNIRRELIDGVVKLMSGINRWHNNVTYGLSRVFIPALDKGRVEKKFDYYAFWSPFDVFLSEDNVVQPDFGIVCDLGKVKDNGVYGSPDFIVEILSPSSLKRDAQEKFSLYERFGVKEYWIISPVEKYVNVFLLQSSGKYDDGALYELNTNLEISLSIIDALKIKVNDIFKE